MLYLFTLGRTVPLCLAELQALFKINGIGFKILSQIENHIIADVMDESFNPQDFLDLSGGVVKIGKLILSNTNQPASPELQRGEYYQILSNPPSLKATGGHGTNKKDIFTNEAVKQWKNFGISIVNFKDDIEKINRYYKEQLNLHYILPKNGEELSSAQVFNKKVLEIVIVKIDDGYQFFQTVAVQDINRWSRKDAGRPEIDDRLGMLPLKVARMMVNLGRSEKGRDGIEGKEGIGKIVLLDPFCGMGSILAEAIDLGVKHVIGGDISEDVLSRCNKNLAWFINEFKFQHVNMMMIKTDAACLSDKLKDEDGKPIKVDLIVTEPFLGNARKIQRSVTQWNSGTVPGETVKRKGDYKKEIENIMTGLEKMYLGCLKDWKKILKPDSVICIIVPEIEMGAKVFTIPFVEICEKTGYNIINQFDYAREKAVVKRKIFLLNLK